MSDEKKLSAVEEVKNAQESAFPHLPEVAVSHAQELDRLRAERSAALDLLAVIHRDGGHHTEGVGFIKSCSDAIAVRNALVVDNDRLRAENELFHTAGIVEIAALNPRVMDFIKHWEERAERAEAALRESYTKADMEAACELAIAARLRGGVVVPEEPTKAMVSAGWDAYLRTEHGSRVATNIYKAMLSAAKDKQ